MFTKLIYRIPNSVKILKTTNFCPNCKIRLKFADIIPVIAYLRFGGKCRYCKAKTPIKYLMVEILTPLIFVALYLFYGMNFDLFLNLALWSMLIIVFVIDLEHMIVSDAVLAMFSPAVIIYIIATGASWIWHLTGLAFGFIFFLLIYLITKWLYKQEAFGFGDVMLSGAVGWFLGLENAILTGIMSFIIAFVVIVFLKAAGRNLKKDMEIPFAPFICIAAVISAMFGEEIIRLYWGLSYIWN